MMSVFNVDIFVSGSTLYVSGTALGAMNVKVPLTASMFAGLSSGPSSSRPDNPPIGMRYFDTDLSESITWTNSDCGWVNDKGETTVLKDTGMSVDIWLRKGVGIIPTLSAAGTDSQDVTDWLDQSPNQKHPQRSLSSTFNPFWNSDEQRLEFVSGESRHMTFGQNSNEFIGNKKFIFGVVFSGSSLEIGSSGADFWLQDNNVRYNVVDIISWSGSTDKQYMIFALDGTNIYARRNGVEVDTAAQALQPLGATFVFLGRTGTSTYMDGSIYEFFLLTSPSGGTFASVEQIEAIEAYLATL